MAEKFGRCRRCGRKLINPLFVKLGYGKTCYEKACKEKSHFKKLFDERMVVNNGKDSSKTSK